VSNALRAGSRQRHLASGVTPKCLIIFAGERSVRTVDAVVDELHLREVPFPLAKTGDKMALIAMELISGRS
jgi:hypothetical protein